MYTEKEALEYLVDLGEARIINVKEHDYSTKQIFAVKELKPAKLQTTTLTSLIDYLKVGIDKKYSEKLLIHVISPTEVALYSELTFDKDRETYMNCIAFGPDNLTFDRFLDTEMFNIMLQSSFIQNEDRDILLKVTGCITDNAVKEVGDNGISQAVTIKTGVAQKGDVLVPNPVTLAPFRTFPEIEQPESKFIFRMQEGPKAAIFKADGGAWRNEAMKRIKEYLEIKLEGLLENIKVIS